MHAALLSWVLVTGAGCENCGTLDAGAYYEGDVTYAGDGSEGTCDSCGSAGASCGMGGRRERGSRTRSYWAPEPQTCYAPRYGCYPGNNRHMNRYPAFHGTYYRTAYNYRMLFDYPWHAGLHEPTSLFSYGVSPQPTEAPEIDLNRPLDDLPPPPNSLPEEASRRVSRARF